MKEIAQNLYQFSQFIPPIEFTIHQYLLASNPAILFASGTKQQAESIVPEIKEILGGQPLEYVFVSHMESDEAGGLTVLKEAFPNIKVICGQLAARELPGWGYTGEVVVKCGGEVLQEGELDLLFVDYPSEVHDQNGLLVLDKTSGNFYSSDLMQRFGDAAGKTIQASWADEVNAISDSRVPVEEKREKLKAELLEIAPEFVAVGHGFCIECI